MAPAPSWAPHVAGWIRNQRSNHKPASRHANIRTVDALDVAVAAPNKTPARISAIIEGIDALGGVDAVTGGEAALAVLLAETTLQPDDLTNIVELISSCDVSMAKRTALLTDVCGHPCASDNTVIGALWSAPRSIATTIAATTGALLPATLDWVRRQLDRDEIGGPYMWDPSRAQHARIVATVQRWKNRTRGHDSLAAFIAAHSSSFNDEETMFAVGTALCSTPAAT